MSADLLDSARAVREGEELDEARLRAYLAATLDDFDSQTKIEIQQFPGGHSNLTYLLRQGDREYILRRPPVGSKVKAAHDMGREYRVLSKLSPAYAKAPRTLCYCEDPGPIGASFYIMDRVRGFILRKNFPPGIDASPTLCRSMCVSLIDTLTEIHAIDYQAIGLGDLGYPQGYVERQVQGWSKRYLQAKTDEIETVDFVAQWLVANMPESPPASLIHNDFKFDNLVLDLDDPTVVLGILDWEMCTIGDPLMDLGTALGYWVEAGDPPAMHSLRFGPTHLPGMLSRQEVAQAYAERTGRSLDDILFYYVFGLFKSLGVVQQIYYRFHKGLTRDPRFAQFIHAVRILSDQARLAIDNDHI
jgi:aminoglycoside phosphotransferase (APT) family kinase protein